MGIGSPIYPGIRSQGETIHNAMHSLAEVKKLRQKRGWDVIEDANLKMSQLLQWQLKEMRSHRVSNSF